MPAKARQHMRTSSGALTYSFRRINSVESAGGVHPYPGRGKRDWGGETTKLTAVLVQLESAFRAVQEAECRVGA
jgi:hypothetical protein